MGAVPKQRISRAQQGKRRSAQRLPTIHVVECPNCGNLHRSHYVCATCGTYKNGSIQVVKDKRTKDTE
jgi:large subunit ribosomal protein L32